MSNTSQDKMLGKPWSIHSSHMTYEKASEAAKALRGTDTLNVKIRRCSDDTFKVKTRKTVMSVAPSKKKKNVDTSSEEVSQTKTRSKDDRPKTRAQRRAEKMRRQDQQK